MKIITGEGQLKIGDKITIIGKSASDGQHTTVKDIVHCERGSEEIIINKKKNFYFRTCMLIQGKSWAKQVTLNSSK